jgi:hypothetical protein
MNKNLWLTFRRARYMLEQYGWTQFTPKNTNGERCIGSAILRSEYKMCDTYSSLYFELIKVFKKVSGIESFSYWNDCICKSKEEAIQMLDKACAYLEKKGT